MVEDNPQIEQHDYDFLRSFWERKAVIAYSLFALNIIIFLLMTLAGGSTNSVTLLAFGVKSNYEINAGEIWRFVTPIFLHIGLLHIASNSYGLWIVGPHVERLYGSARFLFLYMAAGIAGVAASYWYHPFTPSAGASGAIFGLFGVLLVFSIRYRKTVPTFFTKAIGRGILLTLGINLVIGLSIEQIDGAAHLGGLLAGAVLAAVVPFQKPGELPGKGSKVAQAVLVLMIAASFFQVLTHYNGPGLSVGNLFGSFKGSQDAAIGDFVDAINGGQQAFKHSDEALSSGTTGKFEDTKQELSDAIKRLQHIPSLGGEADRLSSALLDVLQKQYAYVEEVERTGKPRTDFIGASPQSRRYDNLSRELEKWVERDGEKYGIKNTN